MVPGCAMWIFRPRTLCRSLSCEIKKSLGYLKNKDIFIKKLLKIEVLPEVDVVLVYCAGTIGLVLNWQYDSG